MTITDTKTTGGPEAHGFTIQKKKKWPWAVGALAVVAAVTATVAINAGGGDKSPNNVAGATLTVVTAEGNHAEQALVNFVAEKVAPKYGIKVAFKGLADSTTLNRAVSTGEVAGTIYQHKLWLGQVLEANPDFKLTAATPVFRWGFGIWSQKYKSVDEIPDGATISLYSDPANEAQGLWLLERAGLLKLADGINKAEATQKDIVENPKGIKIKLLDFAAQSRALPDLDAAVGYTEYYVSAKVPLEQQIFAPAAPDEFAGQLTIGTEYQDTENVKNLVKAFQDPAVQEFLRTDPSVKDLLVPIDAK
ncbi:MetQ/NlpA family ABC transporter substrate-binding protein [Paeniglutamicibacter sp. NPDC012692]|uniref:MetQ/NlpA family ABC transporter substrate-binding protein n=1 Tax=Paeniglutamicibacter sp. NPDC012692 TaxID=3364388 RepID=UPI0036CE433F